MTTYAHAARSGVITFSHRREEPGLIMFASGNRGFREMVETRARHGREGVLLVPGVPEAANDEDAVAALSFFQDWLASGDAVQLAKKYDTDGIQRRALAAAGAKADGRS